MTRAATLRRRFQVEPRDASRARTPRTKIERMQKFSKILIAVAVLGGIVAIGAALGWFASKAPNVKNPVPPADTAVQWHPVETNRVVVAPVVRTTNTAGRNIGMKPQPAGGEPGAETGLITNWEDRVEEI